ncbi:type II toxin-antitoxin system RatA family toxin [Denitratisoma oestradiolicum]|uniref:Ribosome association toxin RatA n=1 Tax=Denitratisoma oestradiolicum TaxID=311182 RepID=A0A6S6XT64_9PROT|nr:type II toxin-antitoxin system RatA family toxin [Denitratisoma oestradiolicum]TWO82244.1 ubiquinone-binding protein [Denitratisoma oestradiolicum]CAB1369193.1 Ribosome association toxin RatA [Denitratisoma oestradiolicum]
MTVVEKTVLIEHTPAQMFELVDRVEDYPKFLPWCGGTELHERSETTTVATLHINYRGVKSHFSTQNLKEAPRRMQISLRDGPMKHLDGSWCFTPLGEHACKIQFRLHYEFSSKMLEKVLGPVFSHIANSFVEAFVKRAKQLHG